MRLRLSLIFAVSRAQLATPPLDVYALDPADCFDQNGPNGNVDLCIRCYTCTYSLDSDGAEGGKNCRDGPFDELDTPLMFKRYCSGNSAGINDDFGNLECGENDQLFEVKCGASGRLRTDNNYWDYQLSRRPGGVVEGTNTGPPLPGGVYLLRSLKSITLKCGTDDCNAFDIFNGMPSSKGTTMNAGTCKTCNYNSVLDQSGEECFTDPNNVTSQACDGILVYFNINY